jgi:hypothetical protein
MHVHRLEEPTTAAVLCSQVSRSAHSTVWDHPAPATVDLRARCDQANPNLDSLMSWSTVWRLARVSPARGISIDRASDTLVTAR